MGCRFFSWKPICHRSCGICIQPPTIILRKLCAPRKHFAPLWISFDTIKERTRKQRSSIVSATWSQHRKVFEFWLRCSNGAAVFCLDKLPNLRHSMGENLSKSMRGMHAHAVSALRQKLMGQIRQPIRGHHRGRHLLPLAEMSTASPLTLTPWTSQTDPHAIAKQRA